MRLGSLGLPEILIVLVVILVLIFGAKRLPELGSSLGRSLRLFKRGVMEEDESEEKDVTIHQVKPRDDGHLP